MSREIMTEEAGVLTISGIASCFTAIAWAVDEKTAADRLLITKVIV